MKLITILLFTTYILGSGLGNVIASPVPQGGPFKSSLDPETSASHPKRSTFEPPALSLDPVSSSPHPGTNLDPNSPLAKLSTGELRKLYRLGQSGTITDPKLTEAEREEVRSRLVAAKDDNSDLEGMTPAELEEELRRIEGIVYHERVGGDSRAYPGETRDSLLIRREAVYDLLSKKKTGQ